MGDSVISLDDNLGMEDSVDLGDLVDAEVGF